MAPPTDVSIALPDWVWQVDGIDQSLPSAEAQMGLVVRLLEANIADGGGPFAAAVFDENGGLVAPGVNRVVPDSAPIAHAEIVAIAAAGQRLGTWDLRSRGRFQLVTSTEPCAMCLGAVPWAGVTSLVVGASDADARAAGFDEGHKPGDWVEGLTARGIEVVRDVGRDRVTDLMTRYAAGGGPIYNGAAS